MDEQRARLDAQGNVGASGEFEILAITAGEAVGHGWIFDPEVLRRSLSLWNGVESFVDHGGDARSVRDLGGMLYSPAWNEQAQGIQATLRASGPSGALVTALGREMLGEVEPKPRVGFSADVLFLADELKHVSEIVKVFSVDLVFDPARGGAFVRAINSIGATSAQEVRMAEEKRDGAATPKSEVESLRQEVHTLLGVEAEVQKERAAMQAVRVEVCGHLLDVGLAASELPEPMKENVRAQFAGKVFAAGELSTAIANARKLVSDLTAGQSVEGVRHVRGMFDSHDQLQAAVDDLLGAPREETAKGLKVARLSGIKELYLMMTGDSEFYGGYYPERARFQSTTATFTGLVKNALNKALVERWGELGRAGYDWWNKVATIEHFNTLNGITWLIFGTVGSLPSVAEGAEYTELRVGDSPETSTFGKYGGYVGITLEALDRDDFRKLRAVPGELANAALRNISSLVAALFTDNSAVGPAMADGGALFNATAVTTAGGHANLLTTALGTTYTAWDAIGLAMYNQPMLIANETGYYGTGKKLAVWPRYCLVPAALRSTAEALFVPRWQAQVPSIATVGGPSWGGQVEVVTVPEWTDATDYAAVLDPKIVPGIMIGERFGIMPEVFVAGDELSPAVFMNDESRIKVRHFVAVGVADFRPLHKENVGG